MIWQSIWAPDRSGSWKNPFFLGKTKDRFLLGAQVVEKIDQVVGDRLTACRHGRISVEHVDHAVHVGADDVHRPAVQAMRDQFGFDIGGPLFFVFLLADDTHKGRCQIDDDRIFPVFLLGVDALAKGVDQAKQTVVAVMGFAVGFQIVKTGARFAVGPAQDHTQTPQGLVRVRGRGDGILLNMTFHLTPFDGCMPGIIGHATLDFTSFTEQKRQVGKDVVNFGKPPGDDKTHFVGPDPITGATAFEWDRRCLFIVAEGVLFGENDPVALLDPFGQTVDNIFETFELDDSGIVHAAIDFRA